MTEFTSVGTDYEINSIVDWDRSESKQDDLLANINSPNFQNSRLLTTPYLALRAVVELHNIVRATPKPRGKSGLRTRCCECGFAYPCPTIRAIEKELK